MTIITQLIISISIQMHFDPALALAVATNESHLNQNKVGKLGEIGIFQIRPEYSKYTKKQLQNLKINIAEGINKLKEAKRLCKHQINNTWLICYNVGVTGGAKIKHPTLFPYYKKVMKIASR